MCAFKRLLVFVFILALISSIAGCGGSGGVSNTSKYTLTKGNHVLLGPIENAQISVYKLTDLKTPIFTTQSDNLGTFNVSLPNSVSNSELLLVVAKNGKDIDYDDDGFKDSNPTKNKGTLYCICKAKELRSGDVNITILSDIVYQYTKHLIPEIGDKLTTEDFWRIINIISSQLVKLPQNPHIEPYYYVVSFNPVTKKKLLRFDYSKFYNGNKHSLMYIYHSNDMKTKKQLLESFFVGKGLFFNDYRYLALRKYVKVTIDYPTNLISSISVKGNGISKDLTHCESFFVAKGSKLTILVNGVDPFYKILKWYGCNSVSEDLSEGYINNIQKNTVVRLIVVPKTIELADNVTVVDLTGAYIGLPSNGTSSMAKRALIPVTSPLLDHITVYADLSDTKMKDTLASIKVGDIIVNKTFPIFFRKVTKIEKITDYRYKIDTQFVPLTKIVKRGYISTSIEALSGSSSSEKVLSRALILPNGKVIPFDPNQSQGILINISNGTATLSLLPKSRALNWSTTATEDYGPFYFIKLDDDNYASIEGSLVIKPNLIFDMSWGVGWTGIHINQVSVQADSNINVTDTLKIKIKKEISKKISILKQPLTYTGTCMVGPIPVVFTVKLDLYCGIKGAGVGEDEDSAHFDGCATVKADVGVNSNLIIYYDTDSNKVTTNYNLEPTINLTKSIEASADLFAYVGAQPSFELYGFGIGMENDIGPYVKASLNVNNSESVSGSTNGSSASITAGSKTSMKISGEIGLGYYGRLSMVTEWEDIDWIKDLVEKVNEAIRGKYTEFWKSWPYKSINKTFNSASETTISTPKPIKLDYLKIIGKNIVIEKREGDNLSKSIVYNIKHIGDSSVRWNIVVASTPPGIEIDIPQKTGKLTGNSTTTVQINISASNLHMGTYHIPVRFFKSPLNYPLEKMKKEFKEGKIDISKINSIVPISEKDIDIKVIPPGWDADFNASLVGTTVKRIQFQWEKYPANTKGYTINGYTIICSPYDSKNKTYDSEHRKILMHISDVNATQYRVVLKEAIKKGLLSYGKTYCFFLYALASLPTGTSNIAVYPNNATKLTIIEIPNNTSGTNENEVDIDFLVDRTGSYGDDIATFKRKAQEIVNTLISSIPKGTVLKVGITSFKDFPPSEGGKGSNGDYPFKLELNLTNNISQFISVINRLSANGGGDGPESQLEALYQSVKQLSWNPAAIKIILLFTDASFHNPDTESYPGHGFKEVKNLLTSNNFAVIGMASGYATEDLKKISNYLFTLTSSSEGVVEKIKELMLSIPGTKVSATTTRGVPIKLEKVKVLPKSIWQGEPNF